MLKSFLIKKIILGLENFKNKSQIPTKPIKHKSLFGILSINEDANRFYKHINRATR